MPRYLLDLAFGAALVLLAATVLTLVGCIGVPALCWIFGLAAIIIGGLLMLGARDRGVRVNGAVFLAVAALGAGLAVAVAPAHAADVIVAPPGDTGLWAWINPYLAEGIGAVVAAFVAWAAKEVAVHTRIKIRADQEAQIRETLKTGLFVAASKFELAIGDHWTPAQQAKVIGEMRTWAEQRAAAQLKRLGLPGFVVDGIAHKVLGQVTGSLGLDAEAAFLPAITGNPGETPALDRAVGPAMGGN